MRTITDPAGTQWTVFEVKKASGTTGRWSYLPTEFGDGWLCFESSVSKRRLTPIPNDWRNLDDPALVRLLGQAQTVNRPRFTDDQPTVGD